PQGAPGPRQRQVEPRARPGAQARRRGEAEGRRTAEAGPARSGSAGSRPARSGSAGQRSAGPRSARRRSPGSGLRTRGETGRAQARGGRRFETGAASRRRGREEGRARAPGRRAGTASRTPSDRSDGHRQGARTARRAGRLHAGSPAWWLRTAGEGLVAMAFRSVLVAAFGIVTFPATVSAADLQLRVGVDTREVRVGSSLKLRLSGARSGRGGGEVPVPELPAVVEAGFEVASCMPGVRTNIDMFRGERQQTRTLDCVLIAETPGEYSFGFAVDDEGRRMH